MTTEQKFAENLVPSVNRDELTHSRAPVRLQKILAHAGVASRRASEELIKSGRVKVNDKTVTKLGTKAIPELDVIKIDEKEVFLPQKLIVVFNKPRKVITSMFDPEGRVCVGDYVKDMPVRLFPVGRLDYDVSGLLLLTNDGDYANKLMHPRYAVKRKYIARVKNKLTEKKKNILQHGIQLPDGVGMAKSVTAIIPTHETKSLVGNPSDHESLLEVIVTEGRNHFVKNILELVGLPVVKLSRTELGPFTLNGIPTGSMRQVALREELCG